jgi:P4 family phage/plasmid primase-like protien
MSIRNAFKALAARSMFVVAQRKAPGVVTCPVHPFDLYKVDAQTTEHYPADIVEAIATDAGPPYGVGIVLSASQCVACFDLDHSVDPTTGAYSDVAQAFLARLPGAYVERSQSGDGLHIFISYRAGQLLPHACKVAALHIEFYSADRFIFDTGAYATGDPAVDHTDAANALIADYFPKSAAAALEAEWTDEPRPGYDADAFPDTDGGNARLVAKFVASVGFRAARGDSASNAEVWNGDADALGARPEFKPNKQGDSYDGSTVDMSLASRLVFWTGGDCGRIERLMLSSPLAAARPKWNNRPGYLRSTIARACAGQHEYYNPRATSLVPAGTHTGTADAANDRQVVEDIPQALHLCTDQANAERLQKRFGNRLIVCAGSFHAWDETRWKLDDSLAQRFACELSKIVRAEADNVRAQAQAAAAAVTPVEVAANLEHPRLNRLRDGETGHKAFDLAEIAKALDTWSKKCEMKSTQDAALGMLKKLLAVDASKLDADPWLLNCQNGTVDLRTGELREHRAADLITKLAPVAYDPAAQAPRFRQFLAEIFADDRHVVEFLSRWFGYAATGSTESQCFVIHHGGGSNGKSTLIDTISNVLGDYASAAPDGLLTAKSSKDVHPAEIADLHGKRLVTASESEDGAKLREAFVKQASGGDKLKGRRLYAQLFEFTPTHKLQLLTNKKPQIRGTEFAMWRRILLVPYNVTFGTSDQVAAGEAQRVGDSSLKGTLPAEYPGILAWIVEGARQWSTQGGLRPPDAVMAASRQYQSEEDRVGRFVQECTRIDGGAWTPVAALYGSYVAWCRDSGLFPFSRPRFMLDLERHVPGLRGVKRHAGHGVAGIALTTGLEPYVPPAPTVAA